MTGLVDLSAIAGDLKEAGLIPGSGRSPGGGSGNPLQPLAWRIPWTEEPGGLQSTGSQRAGHDRSASVHACTRQLCHVFAPGKGISDYNDSKLTPSSRHLLFGTVSQTSLPRSFPSEFSDAAARDLGCDESPRWKVTPRKHHRDGSISV